MAPQLQDLPDELLVVVLGYLPKSDLKSTRLTSTRYGNIGAQWLFQRVYFAPRKAAIDTFLSISANPTFARNVTEVVYDGRQFLLELVSYTDYKKAFDARCEDYYKVNSEQAMDHNSAVYHELLGNFLAHYARRHEQQRSIFEYKKDYEALLLGFKNFPNITTVIALDDFSQGCEWVPLRTDDHSWYHQRSGCEVYMPIAPSSWANWKANEDYGFQKWNCLGIQNLIRAVSKQCQNVKELHLASGTSSAPMTIFEMDEDLHHEACTVAQRLTSLKMDLYLARLDSEDDLQQQYDCLEEFLSQAKGLRCLAMSGRIDASVFKDQIWPHLMTLNLGDLSIDATDLKALTQAHKGTLRELTLRNVYMLGEEGWVDAAKEIGDHLKLSLVRVLGVSDEVTEEETGAPYLEDETSLAVARSFMQSIPRTTLLDEYHYTIIACPGEGEIGHSHSS